MKTSNKILLAAGIAPVLLYLIMMITLRIEFNHYLDEHPQISLTPSTSQSAQ